MKKKQIIGLVVAALVFIATSASSVLTNAIAKKSADVNQELFTEMTGMVKGAPIGKDFVAVVPIQGTIQASSSANYYSEGYNHTALMKYVDDLMNMKNNKGIILKLNTPGGTVYHSDELYLKLMEYKKVTGNPIYAYMEDECCSGGYYISSAADEVYANRNTWTGSIGVIISVMNMEGLYDKIGIKEINIASGKNKAMGSAGQKMSKEQKKILQSLVDESYEQFVEVVAEGRDMTKEQVKELADGRIYSAKQAKEHGLIDDIMGYEDFISYVETQSKAEIYYPSSSLSTLSVLFSEVKDLKSRSDAEVIEDFISSQESGVPLYYAKPE